MSNQYYFYLIVRAITLVNPHQTQRILGSGCGSVGRAVAFNTRGPQFDSSHRQNFIEHCLLTCLLSTVLKRRK